MSEPDPAVQRCLMFADVVESVRLASVGGAAVVARIEELLNGLALAATDRFSGQVLERRGDGLFLVFDTARQAAECALSFHQACAQSESLGPAGERVSLRIGVHLGNFASGTDLYYGVHSNLAARLASLAHPGDTVLCAEARSELTDGLDVCVRDLGECYLKHLAEPVRAYRVAPVQEAAKASVAPPDDPRVGLAILPFGWIEGDEPQLTPRAFDVADVISDQLTSLLSRSSQFRVISRLSADAFRLRGHLTPVAARALRVDYLLTGRLRRVGLGLLDACIQLAIGRTGEVIWEQECRVSDHEALSTDSDLLQSVAAQVNRCLLANELRAGRHRPLPNLAAHTLLLTAVSLMHRFSVRDFERANQLLEALLERVPRHALPLAWMARWHVLQVVQKWSADPRKDAALALQWAHRALEVDPQSSLALTVAGSASIGVKQDLHEAHDFYERAIELNPNESLAWLLKSVTLGFRGDGPQAEASSEHAIRLTPLDPLRFYYDSLGATAALGAGNYDLVQVRSHEAIRANSMHGSAYRVLAIAQWMVGKHDLARQTVEQLLCVEPGSTVAQFQERAVLDTPLNRIHAQALRSAGLPAGVRKVAFE